MVGVAPVALATTWFVFVVFFALCDWRVFGTVMVLVPLRWVELCSGAPVLAIVGTGAVGLVSCVAFMLRVAMMTTGEVDWVVALAVLYWICPSEIWEIDAVDVVTGGVPVDVAVCSLVEVFVCCEVVVEWLVTEPYEGLETPNWVEYWNSPVPSTMI